MKSAKEVKHILINLFCGTFGGDPDELEVWDDPNDGYIVMRKQDGWITTIPGVNVDSYLSEKKPTREDGKSSIIDAFHNFRPSSED